MKRVPGLFARVLRWRRQAAALPAPALLVQAMKGAWLRRRSWL